MTKDAKKAIKQYKKTGSVNQEQEQAILRSMTDEEIEKAIRPFQEKFIKKKISNIAAHLYKEESFENILSIVKDFNNISGMATDEPAVLDELYALVSQFLTKYNYSISHNIVLPNQNRENSDFINFEPILNTHYADKDELNGLFTLKVDGKYYTGILANAMKQNRQDLVMKIIKNIVLPFYENYNNTSNIILDNGYVYENQVLISDKKYKEMLDFIENFDIKFNLEKELYFDCFGKVMASMCLPIRKKDDYELTKDRIKEEFVRYSKREERVYSELFYEVLYRNFSKRDKQEIIDAFIKNTAKALVRCKDDDEKEKMFNELTLYYTDSINEISETWDTFKQYLIKYDMYPYNSNRDYTYIMKALLTHVKVDDKKKFENMFFSYNDFVIKESKINELKENPKEQETFATLGFLQTLKRNDCNLILNDIFNNIIYPMDIETKKKNYYVLEWFKLNGYQIDPIE